MTCSSVLPGFYVLLFTATHIMVHNAHTGGGSALACHKGEASARRQEIEEPRPWRRK